MADTYIECLVRVKQSMIAKFIKTVLIMIAVVFVLFTFIIPLAMIVALIFGIGAYMFNLRTNLEYEYLFLERELTVDKIMAQTKRKRVGVYSLDRIEVLAPINSYHLDDFKNRTVKTLDLSDKEVGPPDRRYMLYYEGNLRLILGPPESMVKAMKNITPRKVFLD